MGAAEGSARHQLVQRPGTAINGSRPAQRHAGRTVVEGLVIESNRDKITTVELQGAGAPGCLGVAVQLVDHNLAVEAQLDAAHNGNAEVVAAGFGDIKVARPGAGEATRELIGAECRGVLIDAITVECRGFTGSRCAAEAGQTPHRLAAAAGCHRDVAGDHLAEPWAHLQEHQRVGVGRTGQADREGGAVAAGLVNRAHGGARESGERCRGTLVGGQAGVGRGGVVVDGEHREAGLEGGVGRVAAGHRETQRLGDVVVVAGVIDPLQLQLLHLIPVVWGERQFHCGRRGIGGIGHLQLVGAVGARVEGELHGGGRAAVEPHAQGRAGALGWILLAHPELGGGGPGGVAVSTPRLAAAQKQHIGRVVVGEVGGSGAAAAAYVVAARVDQGEGEAFRALGGEIVDRNHRQAHAGGTHGHGDAVDRRGCEGGTVAGAAVQHRCRRTAHAVGRCVVEGQGADQAVATGRGRQHRGLDLVLAAGRIPDAHAAHRAGQIAAAAARHRRAADRVEAAGCVVEGHMAEGRDRRATLFVSELQLRRPAILVIVDLDVVPLTRHQVGHGEAVPGAPVISPVVNKLLAVDPHPHAIIGEHGKAVVAIAVGLDLSRCPD